MSIKRTADPNLLVWIDTETTGLDPTTDELLEVAVVVTDNSLWEVAYRTEVLAPTRSVEDAVARMGEYVRDMHTHNGLIALLQQGAGADRVAADEDLSRWLVDVAGEGPFLLGGNSITHDRGFLAAYMPRLFALLHYRSIDVSSIREELARDGFADEIADLRAQRVPTDAHRALGDIRDSVRELAALRRIRSGAVDRVSA